MRDMVVSVREVSTAIESIRSAANEQLQGVNHINASMGGLDQATQQNAAMVEEFAAGATSLDQQAQHLRHAVAMFKVKLDREIHWSNRHLALVVYA